MLGQVQPSRGRHLQRLPHSADFFGKYYTKADHGFWHSFAFTTGNFHEPIQMKARSRAVTEKPAGNAIEDIVHDIDAPTKRQRASCRASAATVGGTSH